jgi:hypothetical protein
LGGDFGWREVIRMKVEILVRGLGSGDVEFLGKVMTAVGIKAWGVRDILVEDLNKLDVIEVGVAMGKVCSRMVQSHVRKLFVLPTVKQLQPQDQNLRYRADAWSKLQDVRDFLEGKQEDKESGGSWQYATVHLPGQKKIVIFETAKPPGVEADVFISRTDSNLLVKMKEAFRAEAVVIGEEGA